ncbi:uncharacterized protein THITE_2115585 [Thermothielavioides terrestris NRRL 8126]|uniref:ABC transporter-like protein n=1 Tax=Thermothielavioides terrestris (strain ATCC 38088 / NRRL 8126) TaxID=578455 RepID=G2R4X9_THETT|nr:uncharacterized protein THITE_2115585 [Thermothielavioides terrestris NRRL 8126]AEO66964.1 hypothetical protein THITE_2115585 [Thermothielavioides terrestris NRRL 8126]
MARSILVAETFIKATQAPAGSGDDGAALTLMSTDMERIRAGLRMLHEVWASVIQAALAAWMLYNRLGLAFVAPIGTVVVCFLGVAVLIHFTGDSQRAWMARVQKRVRLTATVIAGMKNLKMAGFSAAVGDYIQTLRVKELAAAARIRMITIVAAVFAFAATLFSPPLTFAFTRQALDASRMFTSLSFLALLTAPLSRIFQAVPELVSAFACLGRIQAFLEREPRQDYRQVLADMKRNGDKIGPDAGPHPLSASDSEQTQPAAVISGGQFGWKADKVVLRDINTRIPQSSLTIVVGPVGSGKSTLCKALLGEVPFSRGSVILGARFPRVGFCDQTPFLSNGSIRDNIVGFAPFDDERYADVIEAAALRFDLATLPQGDQTNIGSDGISLSGGQKQRVSLARALYLQSDLLVLDDIFSGLDADTEEHVFRSVFGPDGLLRRRRATVVLCTHSVRHLPAADYIIALENGTVVEQGTFAGLMASQGYVQRLGLKSPSDSEASSSSERATPRTNLQERPPLLPHTSPAGAATRAPGGNESRQVGDRAVYKHYFKSMGWFLAASSLFFATLWGFFVNFPTVWLTYWTDDVESERPAHSRAYYAGIYALLQACAMASLALLAIAIFIVSVKRAGTSLHQHALRTLVRAPLRFFSATDTGVVTNLFSQDLNLIDTELPDATVDTLYCVFQALGQAGVMLTSSLYLAISYPFLGALLYLVQMFYLRTSRQLRLLDLEAKSPLYTHFLDTLKGISTLRAFGSVPDEIQKNARLIDSSQRPAYLLLMIQEWLNLVLDLVVMVMAALLTTLAVQLHSSSAFVGASLFSLISFGENLSGIVTSYTRLETSIGAVARLKTFTDTVQPEDRPEEDIVPPEEWPQRGLIELRGVSARYE